MPQSGGWRDVEVKEGNNYSSVRKEAATNITAPHDITQYHTIGQEKRESRAWYS